MICCFPYGAVFATVAYSIFLYLLIALLIGEDGPVCETEPCRSEGVDNAIVNWAADFYLAFWSTFLALHYVVFRSDGVELYGHMTLVYMGVGYMLRGLTQKEYYNNGNGDGKGMKLFFIIWPISYFFLTASIYEYSKYTRRTWQKLHGPQRSKCCGLFELIILETAILFVFLILLTGSVWCAISDDIHVENPLDEFPSDPNFSEPVCIRMISYSNTIWYACQACFWMVTASMLGTLGLQNCEFVWGLPNSLAAAGTIVVQLSTGALWVVVQVLQQVEKDPRNNVKTYSSILFHYGMIMTALFVHNLISTVRIVPKSKKAKVVPKGVPSRPLDPTEGKNCMNSEDCDSDAASSYHIQQLEEGHLENRMAQGSGTIMKDTSEASVGKEKSSGSVLQDPCDTSMDTAHHSNRSFHQDVVALQDRKESILAHNAASATYFPEPRQRPSSICVLANEAECPYDEPATSPYDIERETQSTGLKCSKWVTVEQEEGVDAKTSDWIAALQNGNIYDSPMDRLWGWGCSMFDAPPSNLVESQTLSKETEDSSNIQHEGGASSVVEHGNRQNSGNLSRDGDDHREPTEVDELDDIGDLDVSLQDPKSGLGESEEAGDGIDEAGYLSHLEEFPERQEDEGGRRADPSTEASQDRRESLRCQQGKVPTSLDADPTCSLKGREESSSESWPFFSSIAGITAQGGDDDELTPTCANMKSKAASDTSWDGFFSLISGPETVDDDDCRDEI